jgi:hypothetical protein
MARFCFNANRKDAINFLKMFYERVDVDFEIDEMSSNESCIILKDKRDKDIFMNLSESLVNIDGFSYPSYVPKWKNIRHRGPYLAQYGQEPYFGAVLLNKTRSDPYKLSPIGEQAAFLYAALIADKNKYNTDKVFIQNYWNDFKTYLGKDQPFTNFEDIDWRDVMSKYKKRSRHLCVMKSKYKYGLIEVDGKMFTATPFAADDMSIYFGENNDDPQRGRIRRAITAADVTLNLSFDAKTSIPNISEFKDVVYKPGMKWAAKWEQPITGKVKYMDILFQLPTEEEFVENFNDMGEEGEYDDESEGEHDYGDEPESDIGEEDDLFGDINDISDDDDIRDTVKPRHVVIKEVINERAPKEKLDFSIMDDEEFNLPLSYIMTPTDQWTTILEACNSKFTIVGNLGKVSNSILRLAAEAAAMAIRNGTAKTSKVNNAFIRYAEQRGVL